MYSDINKADQTYWKGALTCKEEKNWFEFREIKGAEYLKNSNIKNKLLAFKNRKHNQCTILNSQIKLGSGNYSFEFGFDSLEYFMVFRLQDSECLLNDKTG